MNVGELLTKRKILANIGALVSGTAAARVLSAIVLVIIARQVGPVSFGQYAAGIALATLASVIFSMGLDGWLLRNGNRDDDSDMLSLYSSIAFVIKAGVGLIWLAGMAALVPLLNPDVYPFSIVLLSAVTVWLEEIVNTAWSTFKTALKNQVTLALMLILQVLVLGTTLALTALNVKTILPYLVGRVAAAAITAVIAVIWTTRTFGIRFEWEKVREVIRATLPYGVSMALALIYGRADVTIIGHWLGKEAVGFYTPAVALVSAAVLIPSSIYGVMLPTLSKEHAKGNLSVWDISMRLLIGCTLLGLILGGGLALFAKPLVRLVYGEAYVISGDILQILSGILVLRFMSFALVASVVAVGWQNQRVFAQLIAAAVNVGMNILIVTNWGILGVAKVYVLSEAVLMIGYFSLLYWWHREETQQQKQVRVAN